jgi:hypothetical protein
MKRVNLDKEVREITDQVRIIWVITQIKIF